MMGNAEAISDLLSLPDSTKDTGEDKEKPQKREALGLLNPESLPWGRLDPIVRFKEAEKSSEILNYRDSVERVFGYESGTSYSNFNGEVKQDSIEGLIRCGISMIGEMRRREHATVFENVPVSNAKIIFEEAEKALNGDTTYNRMLWSAVGLSFKEWADGIPNYIMRKKIEAYTNIDIGEEGIWLSGYPDTEARINQLDKLGSSIADKGKELRDWLEKNYPIPAYEKTIKTPLDK